MTCKHCPAVALMVVSGKGFCKTHKPEAEAAMKALGKRKTGRDYDSWTPEERARRIVEETR